MLQQLEDKLRSLRKRGRRLEYVEKSCWTKFCGAMRPLKVKTLILYYKKTLYQKILLSYEYLIKCSCYFRQTRVRRSEWFYWFHNMRESGTIVFEVFLFFKLYCLDLMPKHTLSVMCQQEIYFSTKMNQQNVLKEN